MAGNNSIQILRGSGHSSSAQLLPGQPYYDYFNNQLYIGGSVNTPINQAKAVGGGGSGGVTSVNNKTGAVTLTKSDLGLSNVINERQYSASNPPPSVWETGKSGRIALDRSETYTKTFDSSYRVMFVTVTDDTGATGQDDADVTVSILKGSSTAYTFTRSLTEGHVNSFSFCVIICPISDDSVFNTNNVRNISTAFIVHPEGLNTVLKHMDLFGNTGNFTIKITGSTMGQEQYIYVTYNALHLL